MSESTAKPTWNSFDLTYLDFDGWKASVVYRHEHTRNKMWQQSVQGADQIEKFLLQAMETEWTGAATASDGDRADWAYVTGSAKEEHDSRKRDLGHDGWTVDQFLSHPAAVQAGLSRADVLALRLYTGPAFRRINGNNRAHRVDTDTTSFCINRAIVKLCQAQVQEGNNNPLVRGLGGRLRKGFVNCYHQRMSPAQVPESMVDWDTLEDHGHLMPLSDATFLSTSEDLSIATSQEYGGNLLFLLAPASEDEKQQMTMNLKGKIHYNLLVPEDTYGMGTKGADVQWVSQFPLEKEYLWPLGTLLLPRFEKFRQGLDCDSTKEIFEFLAFFVYNKKDLSVCFDINEKEIDECFTDDLMFSRNKCATSQMIWYGRGMGLGKDCPQDPADPLVAFYCQMVFDQFAPDGTAERITFADIASGLKRLRELPCVDMIMPVPPESEELLRKGFPDPDQQISISPEELAAYITTPEFREKFKAAFEEHSRACERKGMGGEFGFDIGSSSDDGSDDEE